MKRIFTLLFLLVTVNVVAQTTYHVKKTGSDTNNGLSWNTAFLTPQKALQVAVAGDEIVVAKGNYYPDEGPGIIDQNFNESFRMKNRVNMFGGYAGVEGDYTRNLITNRTILNGEIDTDLTPRGVFRVVVANDIEDATILDGFTIRGGQAVNLGSVITSDPRNNGGGMYIGGARITVSNCIFEANSCRYKGAAIYIDGGNSGRNATILNCTFSNNRVVGDEFNAGDKMGVVFCNGENGYSGPFIANCSFASNVGDAIYNFGKNGNASPTISNCLFDALFTSTYIVNDGQSGIASPSLYNCIFLYQLAIRNTAPGGIASPRIFNCSFYTRYSCIESDATGGATINPAILNSILWNTENLSDVVRNFAGSTATISYSIVRKSFPNGTWDSNFGINGGNNSEVDPAFVDAANDNLRLQPCSPAIDAGFNTLERVNPDPDGNPRITNGTIDIGAYENPGNQDVFPPTVITKDITIALDANGTAAINASSVNNGSYDACGIKSISVKPSTFNCNTVGPQIVTLTVVDNNDNEATGNATVTVLDNTPPQAKCRNVTLQLDATGNASLTTAQVDNGSTDACGIKMRTLSNYNFTCNDIGTKEVTLYVTDNNDNVSTCTATITVEDRIAPVALCKNFTVYLDAQGSAIVSPIDLNNGSTDACGIKSYQLSKTNFDCTNKGTNTVQLTVTDNNDNTASCSAVVTVVDNIPPVINSISANPSLIWPPDLQMKLVTVSATVSDNCPGTTWRITAVAIVEGVGLNSNDPDWEITGANTVNLRAEIPKKSIRRIYRLTITATDVSGNTSTRTTDVIISKNPPVSTKMITKINTAEEPDSEQKLSSDVVVFPNPSSKDFAIQLKSHVKPGVVMLHVMDMYGRVIETKKLNGNSTIRIGEAYGPGAYFVRITEANSESYILKLIKTR